MTGWEKKIIDACMKHYFTHAPAGEDTRNVLRIRSSIFFSDFDTAAPDEKESYLEAAESLEQKGIIKLVWEKHRKGQRLKTLSCEHFEKLFDEMGKPFPKTEAAKIRTTLNDKAAALRNSPDALNNETAQSTLALLEHLSANFGPREIGQGIDQQAIEELIRFLEFSFERSRVESITIRALSILLYSDSKRLESLLNICAPVFARAQKNLPSLCFSTEGNFDLLPRREFPETLISGKIAIHFKNSQTPMVNAGAYIMGIPLESAEEIESIQLISNKKEKTVLTIENKETFYALARAQKHNAQGNLCYDCFLYTGGYPNRAVAALVKTLSASDFSFFHAGDLDPDGILILQSIGELAEKPVKPLCMDAATFDQYSAWGRSLTKPMLRQIEKIREETRAVPDLSGLLKRVEETGLGVEQEIIDYRASCTSR